MAQASTTTAEPVKATAVPLEAPPFQIETVLETEPWLKMLTYGAYGVGKTYLAGTASDVESMRDVIMISAEKGDRTLKLPEDDDRHRFSDIDRIPVSDYKTLGSIYDYLRNHCVHRDAGNVERIAELQSQLTGKEIKPKDAKLYRTVIIDSATEVDQFCLNQLLGVSVTTRLDAESVPPEWADYGKNLGMMLRMIRNFRDLPMNVIMTAGRNYTQDETKKFSYRPSVTGQLRDKMQGFFDIVGYLTKGATVEGEEVARRLYVQPSGKWDAKCRYSTYKGTFFEDPTLKNILKAVGLSEL